MLLQRWLACNMDDLEGLHVTEEKGTHWMDVMHALNLNTPQQV